MMVLVDATTISAAYTGATLATILNPYGQHGTAPDGYTFVGWMEKTSAGAASFVATSATVQAGATYTAIYAKFAWEGTSKHDTNDKMRFQGNVEFYGISDDAMLTALRAAMSVTITVTRQTTTYNSAEDALADGKHITKELSNSYFGIDEGATATAAANSICFRYAITGLASHQNLRLLQSAVVTVNGVVLAATNTPNAYSVAEL